MTRPDLVPAAAGDHRAPVPASAPAVGLVISAVAVLLAYVAHALVTGIGVLTWGVILGVLAANLGLLPERHRGGIAPTARWLLRWGVALLGFSLPLGALVSLGPPLVASVAAVLAATFLGTVWLAGRTGVGRGRGMLMASGVAVCGASAVAAMESYADAREEDVAAAIGMVTLWGTVSMVLLPALAPLLGLTPGEYAVWVGASVHEVGQVVAAAGPAGALVASLAVAVKLTRVLLLAPLVAVVGLVQRIRPVKPERSDTARPPLVPWFAVGFLGCVLVGSTGVVPGRLSQVLGHVQTVALCAGLFGLGTGVRLRLLLRGGAGLLTLSGLATVFITVVALAMAILVR